ncbi:MAG TPA: M20/M25/M40 family metallo-hydrolase [Flavobacterium sp.]|nr:M20/M25/M40 family metallo-hydrolase [Flavobacterium sp.]
MMKPQIKVLFSFIALIGLLPVKAQVYIPSYAAIVNQCSQSGVLADLTEFQNLGVKYRGTAAQANTLQWLKDKYLSYGYSASQIVEDPFTYSGSNCKNLVVTKMGTLHPNTYVIIDGHYDTLTGTGTNDNGSGVAVILEIARLLQNVQTEYSIKFINFSGEEDGLRGSQHYVTSVVNGTTPKMDIRLVLNIDEIGGVSGMTNNTITCEHDTSAPTTNNAASSTMTAQMMTCFSLYSALQTTLSNAYASDYMPFQSNNEIITGLYETNESPYPHTVNDNLANMDPVYVYNVAKGAIGSALHFAVACSNCNLSVNNTSDFHVSAYPNPATSVIYIDKGDLGSYSYKIRNVLGETIASKNLRNPKQTETVNVENLSSGSYFLSIDSGEKHIAKKIMIQ